MFGCGRPRGNRGKRPRPGIRRLGSDLQYDLRDATSRARLGFLQVETDRLDPYLPLWDVVTSTLSTLMTLPTRISSRDGMTSSGSEFLAGPLATGSGNEKSPKGSERPSFPARGQLLMPPNEGTSRLHAESPDFTSLPACLPAYHLIPPPYLTLLGRFTELYISHVGFHHERS